MADLNGGQITARQLKAAGGWTPRIWQMSTGEELGLDEVLHGVTWQPRLVAS